MKPQTTEKNAEYQKKIREKRKSEGKKTLQIPATDETSERFERFKEIYFAKNQENGLVKLLDEHEKAKKELFDLKKEMELIKTTTWHKIGKLFGFSQTKNNKAP
jgi:16S rRNA G527 N7-methylase RsmG